MPDSFAAYLEIIQKTKRKRSEIESSLVDAPVFQVQEKVGKGWTVNPGLWFSPAEAHAAAKRDGYAEGDYRVYALAARGKLANILQAHTEEDT